MVGGGLAAGTFVTELREGGYDGPVTLLTDEPQPPYERPPLSKDLLLGKARPRTRSCTRRAGTPSTTSTCAPAPGSPRRPRGHARCTSAAPTAGYDHLLLATGSRPRRSPLADDSGAPVAYLRTMEDSLRSRSSSPTAPASAIIGGGWIGLEVAAAARNADAEVTLLESLDQPLLRVLGPEVGGDLRRPAPRARRRPAHLGARHRHRARPATARSSTSPRATRCAATCWSSASASSRSSSRPVPPG